MFCEVRAELKTNLSSEIVGFFRGKKDEISSIVGKLENIFHTQRGLLQLYSHTLLTAERRSKYDQMLVLRLNGR